MKILFLTYFYYDIYKPILQEMERQGHVVTVFEDKSIRFDYCSNRLGRYQKLFRKLLWITFRAEKRYWDRSFKTHPELDDSFDVVVCMPGLSFCGYLLNKLRKRNPDIKSCVLINDSSNYYDHYKNKSLYNKIYTFDYKDAEKIKGVQALDAFWEPAPLLDIKYQIMLIGSDHDDRLDIIKKIYPQLISNNISFYIKVVSKRPETPDSFIRRCIMLFDTIIRRKPDPLSIWQEKMKLPFVTDKPIPIEDVTKIISSSECILETDRDGQAGVTLRDMWALASGKKIITTNSYLQNLPYYNDDQIKFIDRENPVIDINFIKTHSIVKVSDIYEKQRIDHWVKRVLTFE